MTARLAGNRPYATVQAVEGRDSEMSERIRIDQDVAATAYKMALEMWRETNRTDPGLADAKQFVLLVNECALALKGSKAGNYDYS